MRCSAGHDNPEGMTFCGVCGTRLGDSDPEVSEVAAAGDGDPASMVTGAGPDPQIDIVPDAQNEVPGDDGDAGTGAAPSSRRRRTMWIASSLVIVAAAGAVAVVLVAAHGSSSSASASDTTSSIDAVTTPLTPEQSCEQTLPSVWNQEFVTSGGNTYTAADADVMNQYGSESAVYQAFMTITRLAIEKQYLVGEQAAANAAMADVSSACSTALAQYSLNPGDTTAPAP